ncbi:SDR family oxidoreductase [Candidatus Woesearchaeota archaeon]|nr:SDR family oxidoreductase [Candidatus Woesearchaeota archaeon]
MQENKKIVLVTGANRGIGFEACRQLGKNGFKVILTSRDEKKGKEAAEKLKKEKLDIVYHQLDVKDEESIKKLHSFADEEFGRLDVLVNNAGIFIDQFNEEDKNKDEEFGLSADNFGNSSIFKINEKAYRETFETNFFGPLRMMRAFIPLMMKNGYGRVVNISSGMGQLYDMNGGYPSYRVSKTALNALTRIFSSETSNYNIKINSMCPGWVKTDMGGPNAEITPKQAADTIVWLAMLPDNGPTGGFFRDKKKIDW